MTLLYPQFLFALAAIAIPIIIHLFNFQRPKKVLFTNVRFLKNVKEATSSKLKLKHLLILAARILFISFLVFAFAQPVIKQGDGATSQRSKQVSIYLDNSFSMQSGKETGSLLDIGAGMVEDLVGIFPDNTSFHFLTNKFDGKDQYFINKEKVREALTEVQFSNTYRNASTIYNRQLSAFNAAGGGEGSELFWFSDFQKSTVGNIAELEVDSSKVLNLVPLQAEELSNIFIDSLWLASPFFKAAANNTLYAKVTNSGSAAVENVVLKLFVENIQVSTSSITLAPNTSATAEFTFTVGDNEVKKCKIAIEDYPITFDNEYFFVLKNAPEIKVMHVWQKQTPYIPNVFSNESLFEVKSFSHRNIDFDFFSKADLIVMEGIETLDVALREALNKAVLSGKSVAIFPSERIEVNSWNSFLLAAGQGGLQVSKPDTLADQQNNQQLAVPDLENPFFQGVFESLKGNNISMPYAVNVVKWSNRGERLLTSKRGSTFLSRFRKNEGQVYVFGAPLDDQYTNLHRHALFIPVMYKMAMFALNESERLAYSFQDQAISVAVNNTGKDNVFKLVREGFELIPEQRMVDKRLVFQLPKVTMQPGFYTLSHNGQPISTIALNHGREESIMDYYTKEELGKLFANQPNIKVFDISSTSDFIKDFEAQSIGIALWKYCLIIALLFLLIETLLIRFWKA